MQVNILKNFNAFFDVDKWVCSADLLGSNRHRIEAMMRGFSPQRPRCRGGGGAAVGCEWV